MRKKLLLVVAALALSAQGWAQEPATKGPEQTTTADDGAFVFSESELDMSEESDVSQDVIQITSSTNMYASNISYTFSPMWFRFRGLDQRYSDTYMNGVLVNSAESGSFGFSPSLGGLNDAYNRSGDYSSPFETNTYGVSALGGSNNYNFRASNYARGNKITLSGTNRNYRARAIYSYGTGLNEKGWAFFGTVGYRWANEGYVEGTFYNSLSYFLSLQKVINDRHSLSLSTWGTPTERAQAGLSTDEAYWLANDYQYNPYWGYQDGKKRNSRIVQTFEPSALLTWDYQIKDNLKLTTTLYGKYGMDSRTRLQYNNSQNPKPDYWKSFPSYNYNVWGDTPATADEFAAWQESYDYWTASKANRQMQWDKFYYANQQMNAVQGDAAYYMLARHSNQLAFHLGSTLSWDIDRYSKFQAGIQLASNKGMHYQTVTDMLGAENLHNVNNYAIGTYAGSDSRVQYDLTNPNGNVGVGDRFGYDYNIIVQKATAWAQYTRDKGISHSFISAKIGGTQMWRDGKMQNGLFADNSLGKSGTARFMDGGFKMGTNLNLGKGHVIGMGVTYMTNAPHASAYGSSAFQCAEMNNNFIDGLKVEHMAGAELGYAVNLSWMRANLTGYFMHGTRLNEWQNYYYDDVNSFTYVSMTGAEKNYYGVELGVKFKVTSAFSIDLLGSMAEAKYMKNTDVSYLLSTQGTVTKETLYNKGMRENGTPLTVGSVALNYNVRGWWFTLKGNYYDRIYLSYAPSLRYESTLIRNGAVDNDGSFIVPEQAKGHGGFMLDGSIGHQFRIAHNPLSVNLMLTNILNNRKMVNRGWEQSRSNYTTDQSTGEKSSIRTYDFQKNPMKCYVQGFNFMLNLNYRF